MIPKLPDKRIELPGGAVGVDGRVSYAYIIPTRSGMVLIDAGLDAKASAIREEVGRMGKNETQVSTVLLTHGHADHWGGTTAFPHAHVYVHGADKGLQLEEEQDQGLVRRLMMRLFTGNLERPRIAGYFSDGDELEFDGERFTVIGIPGHTEGSVAFLWRRILFIGDSVQKSEKGMRLAPEVFSLYLNRIKRELPKLLDYDFDVIAPAHSGIFRDGKTALEKFLSS